MLGLSIVIVRKWPPNKQDFDPCRLLCIEFPEHALARLITLNRTL
jgi:hypothetical protein